MPVLPLKTLSQYRPSCGSGSGLRGVLPGAASWSSSAARCATDPVPESRTALYRISEGGIGPGGIFFEKVGLAAEQSTVRALRAYSYLTVYGEEAPTGDVGNDVPALLEPIPPGDDLADMPASILVTDPSTPVTARFIEKDVTSPLGVLFARSIWLLDASGTAPISTHILGDTSVVVKEIWERQCPDGYTRLSYRPAFFREGLQALVSSVCPLVPDSFSLSPFLVSTTSPGIHQAFPGLERLSDGGSRYPLACPAAELIADTFRPLITGFLNCSPNAGDVADLDDTGVCP